MKVIEKYNNTKTYMYPNGEIATPESVKESFPAIDIFTHIIETDESGEVIFALQNLSAMKSFYGIEKSKSDDESIAAIQEIINSTPIEQPTTEERIAAALEFQNLMSM